VGLAVHDHRVDGAADVVDRRVADDLDHAGLRIDLNLADVAAIDPMLLPNLPKHAHDGESHIRLSRSFARLA
jgi:hypothetical protein